MSKATASTQGTHARPQALALDPWLAYAWTRRGWMSAYLGDSESAIRELRTALFEPLRHLGCIGMGCAHFSAERYDRAALWIRSGVKANLGSFWAERVGVAAAALMGARSDARRMGHQLMRKDPDLTIAEARQAWPSPRPSCHASATAWRSPACRGCS